MLQFGLHLKQIPVLSYYFITSVVIIISII